MLMRVDVHSLRKHRMCSGVKHRAGSTRTTRVYLFACSSSHTVLLLHQHTSNLGNSRKLPSPALCLGRRCCRLLDGTQSHPQWKLDTRWSPTSLCQWHTAAALQ
jgi:hypothetical protein